MTKNDETVLFGAPVAKMRATLPAFATRESRDRWVASSLNHAAEVMKSNSSAARRMILWVAYVVAHDLEGDHHAHKH